MHFCLLCVFPNIPQMKILFFVGWNSIQYLLFLSPEILKMFVFWTYFGTEGVGMKRKPLHFRQHHVCLLVYLLFIARIRQPLHFGQHRVCFTGMCTLHSTYKTGFALRTAPCLFYWYVYSS